MDWVIYSKMSLMLGVVLVSFFRVGFLTAAYLTVANLVRLGIPISVRSQYLLRLLLDCRWLHSTPTYWKTVAANWYRIHTIPKFCHESSWITLTCHNTRRWVGLQRKIKSSCRERNLWGSLVKRNDLRQSSSKACLLKGTWGNWGNSNSSLWDNSLTDIHQEAKIQNDRI